MASRRTADNSASGTNSPAGGRSDGSSSSKASSPADLQKSQIDFQFLNFSHPSQAKASGARRTVRSHVTRQQHQREHAAAAARRAASHTQQSDSDQNAQYVVGDAVVASGLTASPDGSPSPSPTQLRSYVPENRIDPKEIYPVQWQPHIPPILDHYLNNMAVDTPDLDSTQTRGLLRIRFFPFILTDRAPLHAVILLAASHYSRMRGPRAHAIDLLQLRGMAIREINSALEDPVRATSDQLIAAVAKMASYELLFGDRNIFNTHMTGLSRMVSLRGGLSALGLDGLLERIILWIDSNASHITGGQIYFNKAQFPSRVSHPRPDPARFRGGLPTKPST